MKTPAQYAESTLVRADALKRRSTTLKRTAGGIRAEIDAKQLHGLTERELKTLADAVTLLDKLSANMAQAARRKKATEDSFDRRFAQAKALLANSFGRLKTPRELVPMIASTGAAFWLEGPGESKLVSRNLEIARKEALEAIAYSAARIDGDLEAILKNAWQKLLSQRPVLETKHNMLIVALEAEVASPT